MVDHDEDALIRLMFDLRQVWRGDWGGAVLVVLRRGRMQYSKLRDEMAGYSFVDPWNGKKRSLADSELSRTVTRMTEDGWLVRTEAPGPLRPLVSYELSHDAWQWMERAAPMFEWAQQKPEFFVLARQRRGRLRRSAQTRRWPRRADRHAPGDACPE